ncbi:MAG: hypothetical protein L6R39_006570 [Caloplaca ligustica]|nr:MAG: hypothetical protein L6R39_006570 [Caloplaca ligustica]
MPPKPFPYPLGVGVDIVQISRFFRTIGHSSDAVTHWARKVFTRQEWPNLQQIYYRATGQQTTQGNPIPSLWLPQVKANTKSHGDATSATAHDGATVNETEVALDAGLEVDGQKTIQVSRRQQEFLAQFLAGRWAAKEATVKAHRHRRLFVRDISILSPADLSRHLQEGPTNVKLQALVASENMVRIVMDPDVARTRGLSSKGGYQNHYEHAIDSQVVPKLLNDKGASAGGTGREFFIRRKRFKEEEQQVAEINISHDGDYATAVCLALDEPQEMKARCEYVVDDGSGEPLHEPTWGDRGWLANDQTLSEDNQ